MKIGLSEMVISVFDLRPVLFPSRWSRMQPWNSKYKFIKIHINLIEKISPNKQVLGQKSKASD